MNFVLQHFQAIRAFPGTSAVLLGFPNRWRHRIPKGFRNKAQGCEERATLGSRVRSMTTLKGLRPATTAVPRGHNPFRVVKHRSRLPRVARPSQPWALLRNPFGILPMSVSLRIGAFCSVLIVHNTFSQNAFIPTAQDLLRDAITAMVGVVAQPMEGALDPQ